LRCRGLSSTRYVLANSGEEYLILQPLEGSDPFTVTLEAGRYIIEWYSVNRRETQLTDNVTVESSSVNFAPPFS